MKGLKVSNNTRKKYRLYICMFFKWVMEEGHISKNPVSGIVIIIFTRSLSFRVTAETIALLMICVGFLLGIVMLAGIPKFGKEGILKHALLGVALNGLMLAIAIPNFINARNAAIQKK